MAPGFPEDNPWGDRQMAVRASTLTRWLRAGIPFSNAPGVNFEYSNYAYALLGRIITRVSGMKFQTYITRFILEPLGMEATTWHSRRVPREHFAQGYRWEDEQHRAEPVLADGAFAAMAGLFTTVPDFARYMIFLLDAFPPRSAPEKGPIKRATAREMQQLAIYSGLTQHTLPDGDAWSAVDGYGFGLSVWHDARFGYGVAHGGGLPGYGSYFYLLPDHGIGIVALSNKTYGAVGRIFPQLLQALAGTGSLTPRPVEPSAALVAMREVVQHWLEGGTDRELERVAADNFFLDHDLAHRRAERAQLRARLGPTLHVTGLEAPNALRGKWRIECETGTLQVALTLAPTMPPRLQALTLTPQFREPFDA
jgi:CubicO group peptidase (beta-lactamase class C family)